MAANVLTTVPDSRECSKNRLILRQRTNPMKLFPAKQPLASVVIDIRGYFPRMTVANRLLLLITDRFTKLTQAVLLKIITANKAAEAFDDHSVFKYVSPVTVL